MMDTHQQGCHPSGEVEMNKPVVSRKGHHRLLLVAKSSNSKPWAVCVLPGSDFRLSHPLGWCEITKRLHRSSSTSNCSVVLRKSSMARNGPGRSEERRV